MQLLLNGKAISKLKWRKPTVNLKTMLAMKMTCFILLTASLQIAARGYSQNISLSLKNAPLDKLFAAIEQQTIYSFVYSEEALKKSKPVTIEVKNETIENVLKLCFSEQPLTYSMDEKFIIIRVAAIKEDTIVVKGKVLNEHGEPLQDVSVNIKNSKIGTETNKDGEFVIKEARPNSVFVFSHIGYETIEEEMDERTFVVVQMKIVVTNLDETIVKGYYNTTRRLNTGSVSTVTSKEISGQPVSNPLAAMQGRVPGLLIKQANGLPGSNYVVRIRGQNSIQSGNSPLYIIDGVPFVNDADVLTQNSGINANSPFNTINPEDIESIEVLKDADATAIYGSRGANGVILITTKQGKDNKTSVDVNMYSGWGKVTRTMSYLNTQQYLQMRHEAFVNDGVQPDPSSAYDFLVWDSTRYTDLKELLIGGTSHINNINIRLSGGTEKTKFSFGGNYHRETTVFPGDNADVRGSFDLSLTHSSSNNKFHFSVITSYSNDNSKLISQDLTQFISLPPTIPELYDSVGKLKWNEGGFSFFNPLSYTQLKYNVITERLTANSILTYALSSKINIKVNLGYNNLYVDETSLTPISAQDPTYAPTGSSFFGNNNLKNWIAEPQMEYSSHVGKKGILQAMAGLSFQSQADNTTSIYGYGYTNDNLLASTSGAQTLTTTNGNSQYKYESFYGRINFNWNSQYLVNLTGRRDGSSRFGPGKQFANFGAIGTAWIFTKTKLFEKKLSFLSFGKIRGSYGITGNDLIGNYQFLDTYSGTLYQYQGQPALFPTKLFNPDYSWEQIDKLDFAIDLGFLNDRISITSDWFKNKSTNQIINYSLPGQTGFTTVLQNFPGVVQNEGIELSLSVEPIKNQKLSWQMSFNLTSLGNKLVEFPGLKTSSYAKKYVVGKSLNSLIGSVYAGVNEQTGVYQFLTKDKVLTYSPTTDDYTYLGTTDPKYYGGFQSDISYHSWELDFLFEFRKQVGKDAIFSTGGVGGSMLNEPVNMLDRWQQPGDNNKFEMFTQSFGPAGSAAFKVNNSSAVLTDASFARLKNVSLSYSLPEKILKKMSIEKCRLYFEGQNLLTITKYEGADPETQNTLTLPTLRVLAVGVQISL